MIPLDKRLRKRAHVEIAALQDEALEMIYTLNSRLVLHGGTAVWRCYAGNRFSEDIDLYSPRGMPLQEITEAAKRRSIGIPKLKQTQNLVFGKLSTPAAEIRIEINFRAKVSPVSRPYERVNGTTMEILTLTPEDLIIEKIRAYESRRFIRDIYDIYHLSSQLTKPENVGREVRRFLASIVPPVDESNLKAIIYSGAAPTFNSMVEALKRRFQ